MTDPLQVVNALKTRNGKPARLQSVCPWLILAARSPRLRFNRMTGQASLRWANVADSGMLP